MERRQRRLSVPLVRNPLAVSRGATSLYGRYVRQSSLLSRGGLPSRKNASIARSP